MAQVFDGDTVESLLSKRETLKRLGKVIRKKRDCQFFLNNLNTQSELFYKYMQRDILSIRFFSKNLKIDCLNYPDIIKTVPIPV